LVKKREVGWADSNFRRIGEDFEFLEEFGSLEEEAEDEDEDEEAEAEDEEGVTLRWFFISVSSLRFFLASTSSFPSLLFGGFFWPEFPCKS